MVGHTRAKSKNSQKDAVQVHFADQDDVISAQDSLTSLETGRGQGRGRRRGHGRGGAKSSRDQPGQHHSLPSVAELVSLNEPLQTPMRQQRQEQDGEVVVLQTPQQAHTPQIRNSILFEDVLNASVSQSANAPHHRPPRLRPLLPDSDVDEDFDFSDMEIPDSPTNQTRPRSNDLTHHSAAALPVIPSRNALTNKQSSLIPHQHQHGSAKKPGSAKKKKKTSKAWDVWRFCVNDPGNRKGPGTHLCVLCRDNNEISAFGATTSTTTIRRHLFTCHLEDWVDTCDKEGICITSDDALTLAEGRRKERDGISGTLGAGQLPRKAYSPSAFVDALVEFIVGDDLAINIIESPRLHAIFLMLRAELKEQDIPHHSKIRSRIIQVWKEYLEVLSKEMKNSVGVISFTQDLWTDPNMTPFMAVTGHWMEGKIQHTPTGQQYILNLRSELIAFHCLPGRHDGEHIAAGFCWIIDRLEIMHILGYISMDNARNNDTFMRAIEQTLHRRNLRAQLRWSARERQIRCFPHVIHRACVDILDSITDLQYAKEDSPDYEPAEDLFDDVESKDLISMICTIVNRVRSSPQRRETFHDILKSFQNINDLELLRDVLTRWGSTLLMIDRAIYLRPGLDEFIDKSRDFKKYRLSDAQWERLQLYADILVVPYAFQQKLSTEKTPTLCYSLPFFQLIIAGWKKIQDEHPEISQVMDSAIAKLTDYQTRMGSVRAYTLAMFVHPSMKFKWIRKNMPHKLEWAEQIFQDELKHYYFPKNPNPLAANSTSLSSDSDAWADRVLGLSSDDTDASDQTLDDEIERWINYTGTLKTNLIAFWQEHQNDFPTVFRLAMDILPIQPTSVPCERAFSSGKETTTARRNRIQAELMEALQMLKFSYRH